MPIRRDFYALSAALLLSLTAAPAALLAAPDAALATALQATMQQHIDRSRVNGAFLALDLKSGKLRRLAPGAAHPQIFAMQDGYVLCADMRDEAGNNINVDFFVARKGQGFVVYQSEVDNRDAFRALIKQGVAKRLE